MGKCWNNFFGRIFFSTHTGQAEPTHFWIRHHLITSCGLGFTRINFPYSNTTVSKLVVPYQDKFTIGKQSQKIVPLIPNLEKENILVGFSSNGFVEGVNFSA